jgi:hypothetical protein
LYVQEKCTLLGVYGEGDERGKVMRKPLHTPVVEISEGPSEQDARRSFRVGETAFPGMGNPTGHVLDQLKRKARRR